MTCVHRIGKEWNLACAGLERFGFQRLNLKNFANGNSINAEHYFLLFSQVIYTLIILRSWKFTIIVDLSFFFREPMPLK